MPLPIASALISNSRLKNTRSEPGFRLSCQPGAKRLLRLIRHAPLTFCLLGLSGCQTTNLPRSGELADARGLSVKQVLACWGVPDSREISGDDEIWEYDAPPALPAITASQHLTPGTGTHFVEIATAVCGAQILIRDGVVRDLTIRGSTESLAQGSECAPHLSRCPLPQFGAARAL